MNLSTLSRRLRIRGVFWRQKLSWAVVNVPWFFEAAAMVWSSFFFWVVWGSGRRAVTDNLCAVLPHSPRFLNRLRAFRVFLNFAWTFTDTMHFHERRMLVDWEFEGAEHLRDLVSRDGAVILTAHMGNYDLGSHLFGKTMGRQISIVRLPEIDPETEAYSRQSRDRATVSGFRVHYNLEPGALALTLVDAIRNGEIVAIQGDRGFDGIPSMPVELFGRRAALPTGPFALAMTTQVPIFPLFVVRTGRRCYRVITCPPFYCERTGRRREEALERAMREWVGLLEPVIRRYWHQWHTFERFWEEER